MKRELKEKGKNSLFPKEYFSCRVNPYEEGTERLDN